MDWDLTGPARVTVMHSLEPGFRATGVGSLPHTNVKRACDLIRRYLPDIPAWPQLPRRNFRESIYAQYSRGFPGLVLRDGRVVVDRARGLERELEQLYTRYLENDLASAALCPEYAAGLAHFQTLHFDGVQAIKGQVIGPVSWGLTVTDADRRAILYDEVLADAIGKHLRLQAMWQERALRKLAPQTIVFVDEPYLASYGSAYVAVEREQVTALLEEVFGGLRGLKGIHCCGNTDWSLLLSTSVDILNFDAYNFSETLALYPHELRAFLERGGILAWGIVPVRDDIQVMRETPESLTARLEAAFQLVASKGAPRELLERSALLTTACGLGTLSENGAERALQLLGEVSRRMQDKYP
jgi:methionine synthase II (cobalamin-independent)